MGRIAELLHHPSELGSYVPRAVAHRPKSSVGGIVFLSLLVLAFAWMWPEIQRYLKIRRM